MKSTDSEDNGWPYGLMSGSLAHICVVCVLRHSQVYFHKCECAPMCVVECAPVFNVGEHLASLSLYYMQTYFVGDQFDRLHWLSVSFFI